jgi:hypothetical protein
MCPYSADAKQRGFCSGRFDKTGARSGSTIDEGCPDEKPMESRDKEVSASTDTDLILPFVLESRRMRWRELFHRPKGRKKLLATLWNGDDFDRTLFTQLQSAERSVSAVLAKLQGLGAPSHCHLISARSSLDGKNLELSSALQMVFDLAPGTIISCIPGELAYYQNDDKNGSYIIKAAPLPRQN